MSDPSFPNFGPFVLLQAMVGFAILLGSVLAWWRGGRRPSDVARSIPTTQLFFDGPIKVIVDTLQGIYRVLQSIREDNQRIADETRERHEREMTILHDLQKPRR